MTYLKVIPCSCGEPGCDVGYEDVTDEVTALRAELDAARAEVERMRPVVDAAKAWRGGMAGDGWTELDWALARTIDQYLPGEGDA